MSENVAMAGSTPARRPDTVPGPPKPTEAARETVLADLRVLVNHPLSLTGDTSLEEAQKFFGSHDLEFIAVVDNGRAIGLCARRRIGIVLGSRYGFSLFSRNPVRDYLVPEALVIRCSDSIHAVLKRLSSRPDESFYDDVLLEDDDGTFIGSIFVRNLVRLQHNLMLDNIQELERNRVEIERKNIQMEQELVLAGKVQQAMLPLVYPVFAGHGADAGPLEFHHRYLPAGKVSGDFFHVRRISDHQVGIFICDVMGHGVRSAMITSMLRALVEELQSEADEPGELLERLNDDLFSMLHQSDETMYASGIYMVINTMSLGFCWASAGHPAPMHLRARDGSVEPLPVPREKCGKVLGLIASASYQTCEATLAPGDKLLLYTDGIYEIFAGEKEFGLAGFRSAILGHFALPTPQLLDGVLESALAFSGSKQFEDDVCLLGVEVAAKK
jgi:phosphoserine phosphatase RsbU/P